MNVNSMYVLYRESTQEVFHRCYPVDGIRQPVFVSNAKPANNTIVRAMVHRDNAERILRELRRDYPSAFRDVVITTMQAAFTRAPVSTQESVNTAQPC